MSPDTAIEAENARLREDRTRLQNTVTELKMLRELAEQDLRQLRSALATAQAEVAELRRELDSGNRAFLSMREQWHKQLAAAESRAKTPEQRVLDACAAAVLCDDDPDLCEAEPFEPQEHGEDCYIYTDDQYAIAKAILQWLLPLQAARRAAAPQSTEPAGVPAALAASSAPESLHGKCYSCGTVGSLKETIFGREHNRLRGAVCRDGCKPQPAPEEKT